MAMFASESDPVVMSMVSNVMWDFIPFVQPFVPLAVAMISLLIHKNQEHRLFENGRTVRLVHNLGYYATWRSAAFCED